MPVFKDAFGDAGAQRLAVHGLEILLRRQIEQQRLARLLAQLLVQVARDLRAPEVVQVGAMGCGQACTHLQAVGLHAVERPQHAVETAQNRKVVLRPGERRGIQAARVESVVDVAIEGQQCLARVGFPWSRAKVREARHIQRCQCVADVHQRGQILRRKAPQHPHQFTGLRRKGGQRVCQTGWQRRVEIKGLGGREQDQHAVPHKEKRRLAARRERRTVAGCGPQRGQPRG